MRISEKPVQTNSSLARAISYRLRIADILTGRLVGESSRFYTSMISVVIRINNICHFKLISHFFVRLISFSPLSHGPPTLQSTGMLSLSRCRDRSPVPSSPVTFPTVVERKLAAAHPRWFGPLHSDRLLEGDISAELFALRFL